MTSQLASPSAKATRLDQLAAIIAHYRADLDAQERARQIARRDYGWTHFIIGGSNAPKELH